MSGLILDTAEGVARTARGKPAQGSNTGPRAGLGMKQEKHFGVDMPVIDPGDPGNSWLMYKLLLAVPPASSQPSIRCGVGPVPFSGLPSALRVEATALSQLERDVLHQFVPGREMPYPSDVGAPPDAPSENPPLTLQELDRVRLWITQGARVSECGFCQ
jgi:hypothetical protein